MMRRTIFFASLAAIALLAACHSSPGDGVLFDGTDAGRWEATGEHVVADGILSLKGDGATAVLKNGRYKDFELEMEMRTLPGGKGFVAFHSDKSQTKGYRVAVNNDRNDPVWWKMTGSLLSVRNLTKSFVREGDWFTMTVRVSGRAVTIAVDGRPVVEYIEPSAPCRLSPNEGALLSDGTFALASEAGEIQFRRIAVKTFRTDPAVVQAQLAEAGDEQRDEIIRLHQEDFPVLDYHVHLKGGLTEAEAAQMSRKLGINYAVAPNCGIGFPVTDDAGALAFLDSMRAQPFILAMQAEGREWVTTFSQAVRDEFDYVFTDALTFTDDKGRRTRLWMPDETWIDDDRQQYMDLIVDRICEVLKEPADVYVNPCFLPEPMDGQYDAFWTEARMNRFVDALAKSGEALEINARYKIPNKAIILKAKEAGVKFTFGTNNGLRDIGKLEYCIRMKKECGITAEDMYKPSIKI
ncbi:MAG: DUF1080 domain-containing protein [Tannerella sp.]|jgi:hypothetical protein|nr:DUF1080 domain-containing protein [Tannerella sp.]